MRRATFLPSCAVIVALLGLCLYAQFLTIHYGDKQWEMLYARMWAGGGRFYHDFFPVAPPLFFWIYGIPARLALLPGFPGPYALMFFMGICSIVASVTLSTRLIALHPGFAERSMRMQFAALLCFVLLYSANPWFFLDREHLFLVLSFPYITRFMPGLARVRISKSLSILTGLLAAIGFCIKPYFLVIWAGIQLLYFISHKSLRILFGRENIIIYSGGLLYALLVRLLYPEYFSVVLPMALATYSATRDITPVFTYASHALMAMVPTALMFRLRHRSPYRADILYFAGLLPFCLVYVLLSNNWLYTYYPMTSITLVLAGFVLWQFLFMRREEGAHGLPSWQTTLGIALCCLALANKAVISTSYFVSVFYDPCHRGSPCDVDSELLKELKGPGGRMLSFGTISIDFVRWARMSDPTGAPWVTRFAHLWMLPQFFISGPAYAERNVWILDYVADALAEDVENNKPDVMFVDNTDNFYAAHGFVDLVSLFSARQRFRDAWQHYRFESTIDLCPPKMAPHKELCSYFVYRRRQE